MQGWKEQLDKARDHYSELKQGATSTLDNFLSYEDEEDDMSTAARPRRRVSRRGSHLSSLAHSHSGSIELQENLARRDPSFELRSPGYIQSYTVLSTHASVFTKLHFCV
jgi:hypothetical protein